MVYKNNAGVNQWKVGMFYTPCEAPCLFCFNCACAPCGAYRQRERLLGDAPYYCCMGAFPCLCLKSPCDKVPFLCCEVALCTICAITANRAYIQRTKGVQNDACDTWYTNTTEHTQDTSNAALALQTLFISDAALLLFLVVCSSLCVFPQPHLDHLHLSVGDLSDAVHGTARGPLTRNAVDCFYYSQRHHTTADRATTSSSRLSHVLTSPDV